MIAVFDLFHHWERRGLPNVGKRGYDIANERAVAVHIGRADFKQIIISAGHHMAGQYFGHGHHGAVKLLKALACRIGELNLRINEIALLELFGIKHRLIAIA